MYYVYPAIFTPPDDNEDGFDVYIPDLTYCRTCGDTLADAMDMAEDAMAMWLAHSEDENHPIPTPSEPSQLKISPPQFVNFVKADTDKWRRENNAKNDNRAVRKNLTIPAWLNQQAEAAHVNFSSILQEALKAHLKISQ